MHSVLAQILKPITPQKKYFKLSKKYWSHFVFKPQGLGFRAERCPEFTGVSTIEMKTSYLVDNEIEINSGASS